MQAYNKKQILIQAAVAFNELTNCSVTVKTELLFYKPGGKWSVAENIQHLILSTGTTNLAFKVPSFLLRLIAGKPNRPSRTYDELLTKYNQKIEAGGSASARYIPKPLKIENVQPLLIKKWQLVTDRFLALVDKNTTEYKLDHYIIPHPLLGKITLRELCYFTIFHTLHHVKTINTIIQQKNL